ncbi:hypothetical protein JCM10212_005293 [Sporobolomyces blumeae]
MSCMKRDDKGRFIGKRDAEADLDRVPSKRREVELNEGPCESDESDDEDACADSSFSSSTSTDPLFDRLPSVLGSSTNLIRIETAVHTRDLRSLLAFERIARPTDPPRLLGDSSTTTSRSRAETPTPSSPDSIPPLSPFVASPARRPLCPTRSTLPLSATVLGGTGEGATSSSSGPWWSPVRPTRSFGIFVDPTPTRPSSSSAYSSTLRDRSKSLLPTTVNPRLVYDHCPKRDDRSRPRVILHASRPSPAAANPSEAPPPAACPPSASKRIVLPSVATVTPPVRTATRARRPCADDSGLDPDLDPTLSSSNPDSVADHREDYISTCVRMQPDQARTIVLKVRNANGVDGGSKPPPRCGLERRTAVAKGTGQGADRT